MHIHHIEESYADRWMVDPDLGTVKRRELVMKPSGTAAIAVPPNTFESLPDGGTFNKAEDGTFDVPDDVGEYFTRMPGWHAGESPFPPEEHAAASQPGEAPGAPIAAEEDNPEHEVDEPDEDEKG
jgi:hypothetical protein